MEHGVDASARMHAHPLQLILVSSYQLLALPHCYWIIRIARCAKGRGGTAKSCRQPGWTSPPGHRDTDRNSEIARRPNTATMRLCYGILTNLVLTSLTIGKRRHAPIPSHDYYAKFRQNRSIPCRAIAIFRFFKMTVVCLGFLNFEFFMAHRVRRANMHQRTRF